MNDMSLEMKKLDGPLKRAIKSYLNLPPERKNARASASDLLPYRNATAVQESENDMAEVVIVCDPDGTSLEMGGLHPRASLYEKPVNLEAARTAHAEFRRVMAELGVKVLTVKEILAQGVDHHVGARVELENLAMQAVTYRLSDGLTANDLEEEDRYYITDAYKRKVIEHMSVEQLINALLVNPNVELTPSYRDTGLRASYRFSPLSNLVYTRDQQITTAKGIVLGKLRSSQRALEVALLGFCLCKLGLSLIGEIVEPGFLEGGDFIPASKDLALLGIGLRSNYEAARQLMDQDLLGTRRFAVVRDDFEQHQDRMHLDCVFAILSDKCCLMLDEMMGENAPTKRLVDEYTKGKDGKYHQTKSDVEFSRYMIDEGYHIIPISGKHQLQYACNILNLGGGRIISVHMESARQIVENEHFAGDVRVIDYSPITSMYGAVHCSSQVVIRRSSSKLSSFNL